MSWLHRLFRPHIELETDVARRVAAWQALPSPNGRAHLMQQRFVVLDTETSGLDPRRDRVLALAAVEVVDGRIRAGGVARVLRQAQPSSADNILVHGITPATQAAGVAVETVLLEFLEYAGKDPLVAFHAGFDREVLGRACRETLGVRLANAWLDMAALAQALAPEAINGRADLDRLVAYFGISTGERHRAVSDARATAELFLMLLARARERRTDTLSALQACAERSALNGAGRGLAAP